MRLTTDSNPSRTECNGCMPAIITLVPTSTVLDKTIVKVRVIGNKATSNGTVPVTSINRQMQEIDVNVRTKNALMIFSIGISQIINVRNTIRHGSPVRPMETNPTHNPMADNANRKQQVNPNADKPSSRQAITPIADGRPIANNPANPSQHGTDIDNIPHKIKVPMAIRQVSHRGAVKIAVEHPANAIRHSIAIKPIIGRKITVELMMAKAVSPNVQQQTKASPNAKVPPPNTAIVKIAPAEATIQQITAEANAKLNPRHVVARQHPATHIPRVRVNPMAIRVGSPRDRHKQETPMKQTAEANRTARQHKGRIKSVGSNVKAKQATIATTQHANIFSRK